MAICKVTFELDSEPYVFWSICDTHLSSEQDEEILAGQASFLISECRKAKSLCAGKVTNINLYYDDELIYSCDEFE